MIPGAPPPFRRRGERIQLRLSEAEAALLESVPELLEGLGDPAEDAAAARLDPPAHPDDPEAEDEYRRLVEGELNRARRTDRRIFARTVTEAPEGALLDEEGAGAWLRVLDETRLVLAARMGIEEEGWEGAGQDDPRMAFLHYLSWLQEELIEILSTGLDAQEASP